MTIRKKILALVAMGLLAMLNTQNTHSAVVIFDMNGVLSTTDSTAAFWQTGPKVFLSYAAKNMGTLFSIRSNIQEKLFTFLSSLVERKPGEFEACDAKGNLLPQIMIDWLKGDRTSDELIMLVIDKLTLADSPYTDEEKDMLLAASTMIFTPEIFVKTNVLFEEGKELVTYYKEQGHQIYILSNWDRESYELFRNDPMYQDFFDQFDGIFISGDYGALKPDPAIYQMFLARFNLNACECVFIDDRPENIDGAERVGIRGVLCGSKQSSWKPWKSEPDYATVMQQVDEHLAEINSFETTASAQKKQSLSA